VLAAWRSLLAADGPLGGRPVTRVIATHMHPDHMGMAGWLTRKHECAAVDDARGIPDVPHPGRRHRPRGAGRRDPLLPPLRLAEEALDVYRARFGGFGKYLHALPDSFRRIVDGELITIGAHTTGGWWSAAAIRRNMPAWSATNSG
jgi:glyoxylase-like metal-dependent hydrolase (beta-lactamase superfamily II)